MKLTPPPAVSRGIEEHTSTSSPSISDEQRLERLRQALRERNYQRSEVQTSGMQSREHNNQRSEVQNRGIQLRGQNTQRGLQHPLLTFSEQPPTKYLMI